MIHSMPTNKKYRDNYDRVFRGGIAGEDSLGEDLSSSEGDWPYRLDAVVIKTEEGDIVVGGNADA